MKKLVGNQKGFSLVELIIVIAIMAVLIGLLTPQLIGYIEKSREAKDISNIESIKSTIEAYVADLQLIPGSEINITVTNSGGNVTASIGGSAYTAGDLEEYGVADTLDFGSDKWEDIVITYNMAGENYIWTYTPDMSTTGAKYYNYDGSAK